ncbi:MAG: radical SAM protein [Bdellovibrionota bacterium]
MKIDTICVELTITCPLLCIHCSANASPFRRAEIDAELLCNFFSTAPQFKEVYLSGGEPFEHSDLFRILNTARSNSENVVMYSSGATKGDSSISPLPVGKLLRAKEYGISRIDLSVYSTNESEHDSITCVDGSLKATLESARRIVELGIPLGIHHVPIIENQLLPLSDLAQCLGASRLHIIALASQGRASRHVPLNYNKFKNDLLSLIDKKTPHELIISSAIRKSIELNSYHNIRDSWCPAFMDVHGQLYPREDQRHHRDQLPVSLRTANYINRNISY